MRRHNPLMLPEGITLLSEIIFFPNIGQTKICWSDPSTMIQSQEKLKELFSKKLSGESHRRPRHQITVLHSLL
jgi:hypothetical protein